MLSTTETGDNKTINGGVLSASSGREASRWPATREIEDGDPFEMRPSHGILHPGQDRLLDARRIQRKHRSRHHHLGDGCSQLKKARTRHNLLTVTFIQTKSSTHYVTTSAFTMAPLFQFHQPNNVIMILFKNDYDDDCATCNGSAAFAFTPVTSRGPWNLQRLMHRWNNGFVHPKRSHPPC